MPRRGVGSKAISAPEGTQLSSRCDGRLLLAPTGATSAHSHWLRTVRLSLDYTREKSTLLFTEKN